MTTTFRTEIQGLNCASCVRKVETALNAIPGVSDAHANLATGTVDATLSDEATPSDVIAKLDEVGYPAITETRRFAVQGMSCASCVARLEGAPASAPGVQNAQVNLANQTATVTMASGTDIKSLQDVASATGYPMDSLEPATTAKDRHIRGLCLLHGRHLRARHSARGHPQRLF